MGAQRRRLGLWRGARAGGSGGLGLPHTLSCTRKLAAAALLAPQAAAAAQKHMASLWMQPRAMQPGKLQRCQLWSDLCLLPASLS